MGGGAGGPDSSPACTLGRWEGSLASVLSGSHQTHDATFTKPCLPLFLREAPLPPSLHCRPRSAVAVCPGVDLE